ncbi:MAG TPA: 3' terminal RNA ribose 2'-O-methyltransferase Hen1 [Gemmatimonadaceae bacterium]|jgi:3' terminal RNA ribose 2'-O-methyltransferase Hen1|nr:3' terminal RNA ribose 2'-O-methyltransferase Hen1 [Gemmatimonadaceae bacterium]
MLLTIRTTHRPATDLGFLLHKNPARVQSFEQSFGQAHVFYPEASADACTAALLLDVDAVALVRGRRGPAGEGGTLAQYVNDRPYVASSFLSVAIASVFGSALAGRSKERPDLVTTPIPLRARIAVVPCRGGAEFLRRLFEPLGYAVTATSHPLDIANPTWGDSRYLTVELSGTKRLSELLTHLYVLVPVLDDEKHYWVGSDEVEKLLRHGEGWLGTHPERETIAMRYLCHQRSLVDEAISRLVVDEDPSIDEGAEMPGGAETQIEEPLKLNEQRLSTVVAALKAAGAKRVVDLGCGEGRLLRRLLDDRDFEEIIGMDVSHRALETASARLRLDRLAPMQRERIRLIHGSLLYRDSRLTGYDAATVVEVVEHLDPPRLAAFERVVFEFARPRVIILTTPNAEYNVRWPTLGAGTYRHKDHRFEWTRDQFQNWARALAVRFAYDVRFVPVGSDDPQVGPPTQMAVFTRTQTNV